MSNSRKILLIIVLSAIVGTFTAAAWFDGYKSGKKSIENKWDDEEEYKDYVERRQKLEKLQNDMARWDERYARERGLLK